MKNNLNKKVKFDLGNSFSKDIKYINFYSKIKKNWESIPDNIISYINTNSYDLMIKFGMGLLTIPKNLDLRHGILSYHHGDPKNYRGRPAGFYELLKGKKKLGQIVQLISNKLDSGKILYYGETKISPWSYKKTMNDSYKISPIIFAKFSINLSLTVQEEPNLDDGVFI